MFLWNTSPKGVLPDLPIGGTYVPVPASHIFIKFHIMVQHSRGIEHALHGHNAVIVSHEFLSGEVANSTLTD
jgi:hypothetical protein